MCRIVTLDLLSLYTLRKTQRHSLHIRAFRSIQPKAVELKLSLLIQRSQVRANSTQTFQVASYHLKNLQN